ncbi:FixH family protein [Thermoflexibacter ruber]|uniref:FixH protein n=1 Tax=Thermoflexibacter ruber TaxID=1003 RepID=A0A1I2FEV5_9BACT|nr:FixH family protein [Thermoflexibacter ruber]SFF03011.1 FixH protein [Thermoflexibacter ruber]
MKISIPTIIISTFVAFAGMIGYFVTVAMRSEVNLVRQDYYQEELKHQEYMETVARTEALGEQVKVVLDREKKVLNIFIGLTPAPIQGKIKFYRPSSSKLDFEQDFNTNADGLCEIPLDRLIKGNWKMTLAFEVEGKKYLKQTSFNY